MKICPDCRRLGTLEDDKYCFKDGAVLVQQSKCLYCNRELMDGVDVYCPRCGNKIPEAIAAPTEEANA